MIAARHGIEARGATRLPRDPRAVGMYARPTRSCRLDMTVLCVLTHQGTFRPAPSSSDGLTPAPVVAVADIISFRDGRKLVLLRGLSRDVQPCRNDLFPQVLYCCIEQALQALLR